MKKIVDIRDRIKSLRGRLANMPDLAIYGSSPDIPEYEENDKLSEKSNSKHSTRSFQFYIFLFL